jgi:regulator of sigma E protease
MTSVPGFEWIAMALVLTGLVFFHELGHYLVARWNGVRIEVFSIGFGPELFGWNDRAGTRWKFSAIPLGGYVKMFGDADAASMPSAEAAEMTAAEKRVSFHHKRLLQRTAIVAAGPIANFILAILLLAISFAIYGKTYVAPAIGYVVEDSAAAHAGMKIGDVITAIDGQRIESFGDIPQIVALNTGTPLDITLRRGEETIELRVTPKIVTDTDRLGLKYSIAQLGVQPFSRPIVGDVGDLVKGDEKSPAAAAGVKANDIILAVDGRPVTSFQQYANYVIANTGTPIDLRLKRGDEILDVVVTPIMKSTKDAGGVAHQVAQFGINGPKPDTVACGPVSSLWYATVEAWQQTTTTLRAVGQMILGRRGTDSLSGLISIGGFLYQAARDGSYFLLQLAAFISLNLGLINLFPIPVLDGGHLLFYAAEGIRGKPLGQRAQEYGFRLGLALVLMLMILANWNDLNRWGIVGYIKRLVT